MEYYYSPTTTVDKCSSRVMICCVSHYLSYSQAAEAFKGAEIGGGGRAAESRPNGSEPGKVASTTIPTHPEPLMILRISVIILFKRAAAES